MKKYLIHSEPKLMLDFFILFLVSCSEYIRSIKTNQFGQKQYKASFTKERLDCILNAYIKLFMLIIFPVCDPSRNIAKLSQEPYYI